MSYSIETFTPSLEIAFTRYKGTAINMAKRRSKRKDVIHSDVKFQGGLVTRFKGAASKPQHDLGHTPVDVMGIRVTNSPLKSLQEFGRIKRKSTKS